VTAATAEVDELLSAVADPTRQAVAKQLAVLNRAGLVEGTRRGREIRYAIRPQRLGAATRSLAQVAAEWDSRLSAIKRIAESVALERQEEETP
jgi:DNA-binding transcriptional ArsR family regulator